MRHRDGQLFLRLTSKLSGALRKPQQEVAIGSEETPIERAVSLPVVHRLAILYLVLPVVIWLVGWFHWWLGIPAALLIAAALGRPILPSWKVTSWKISFSPTTGVLLLIALALVMATAAGGVFDLDNHNFIKHRAILLHLSRDDWPIYFTTYLELPLLLRYYLGYYIVPGLLGKWFGVAALNWAVPLWTWCGAALALLLFTRGYRGWTVLVAVPTLIFFGMAVRLIPVWEIAADYSFLRRFAFSPQHIIAAVLYSLLLIQLRKSAEFLKVSGIVIATSLLWSPFIAIGLLPLVGVLILQNGVHAFLRWKNLLATPPLALLLIVYLSSGTNSFPHGWIWEVLDWHGIAAIVTFVTTLLLLAFLILLLRPSLRHDPMFLTYPVVLPVSLLYSYGFLNDWSKHILSLTVVVLCYYGAKTLVLGWRDYREWYLRVALGFIILVVVSGSIPPAADYALMAVNSRDFRVFRYERMEEQTTLLTAIRPHLHGQYAAPATAWQQLLLRDDGTNALLDKGQLIINSDYAVYLRDKRLVYVQPMCGPEEFDSRFILHVVPVDRTILEGREHDNQDFYFDWNGIRLAETCIVVRDLPAYEIASFTTGQYIGGQNPRGDKWLAVYRMGAQ